MSEPLAEIQIGGEKSAAQLSVQVVSDIASFERLQPEWDRCFDAAGYAVFQSYDWQRTWWKHFGEGNRDAELNIVVLRVDRSVVAIAPFYIETVRAFPLPGLRKLTFIGTGLSDFLDILVLKGYEEAVAVAVAAYIAGNRSRCAVIQLEDMPDRSLMSSLLHQELSARNFSGARFINEYCPRTPLKENWEATLATLETKHRRDIRYKRTLICRDFQISYERTTKPEDVAKDVDEFILLHQQRWQNKGQTSVFREDRIIEFHREVASKLFRRGWLFLSFLRINGARIGANYGFKIKDELSTYLPGMAEFPAAAKYSPGFVLHGYSMEDAVREGMKVYDFLRGREKYKYFFDAVDVPNWTILMYDRGAGGAERRFKYYLLNKSFKNRSRLEISLWKHAMKTNGLFSKGMAKYLVDRTKTIIDDGLKKAKAPEKSIATSDQGGTSD